MSVVPRLLTRNWRLKLAALGLAIFLWAVVRTAPDSTATVLSAPVQVDMSESPGWTTARPPEPSTVDVHVRGSFADIEQVRRSGATVRVPLGAVAGGDTVVTLRPDWTTLEGPVSVERIDPAQVRLSFEQAESAARPISIRPVGELPDRWALAEPLQLSPVVVRVTGATSLVEAVDSIPTVGPDLSEIDERGVYEVPLDTAAFPGLTFARATVSVGVRLEAAVEEELGAVPVELAGSVEGVPASELSWEPPLVQVTLHGGRTRVAQAQVPALHAEVDSAFVQRMEPGEVRVVPLRLVGVPPLVEARAEPDSVRVRRRPSGEEPGEGVLDGGASGPSGLGAAEGPGERPRDRDAPLRRSGRPGSPRPSEPLP